jgi:MFS family permease
MNPERPKIFYGYIVVAAAFAIMLIAWGGNRTFGVFLDPMIREFGWTRAGISGAFTLGMVILGLISLLAGRLTDQIGPRALLIACSLFLGAGYALSSQVQSLWHLYLYYGIFTGIGMSGAWAPIMSVITRWFVKKKPVPHVRDYCFGSGDRNCDSASFIQLYYSILRVAVFFSPIGHADFSEHLSGRSLFETRPGRDWGHPLWG